MSIICSSFINQSWKFIWYLNKHNRYLEKEQNILLSLKFCGFRNLLLKILWVPRNPRNPHQQSHCRVTFLAQISTLSSIVKIFKLDFLKKPSPKKFETQDLNQSFSTCKKLLKHFFLHIFLFQDISEDRCEEQRGQAQMISSWTIKAMEMRHYQSLGKIVRRTLKEVGSQPRGETWLIINRCT